MKNLGIFRGIVLEYKALLKFGFIKVTQTKLNGEFSTIVERYDEVFIHVSDIEPDKDYFKKLIQGQQVEFEMCRNSKGLKAINLKIIGDSYDDFGEINYNI